MRIRLFIWTLLLFLPTFHTLAQSCEAFVEDALDLTAQACQELGRNQACYGNFQVDAEGRTADFSFATAGDIADLVDVERISTAALDEAAGIWGISLLKVQANLPDTLSGQNVTMILIGDTRIENRVSANARLSATLNARGRIRSTPDSGSDANILTALDAGAAVIAYGRNEAGDWVKVIYGEEEEAGWVAAFVLNSSGDPANLPVLDDFFAPPPAINPMQAFYLSTGIGRETCNEAPADGVMIHTPEGTTNLQFEINGVEVFLNSTLFVSLEDSRRMSFELLTGSAVVRTPDGFVLLGAGTKTSVPLSADGRSPAGAPEEITPTAADRSAAFARLIPLLTAAEPVTEALLFAEPAADIEAVQAELVASVYPYGILPGVYELVAMERIPIIEPGAGAARCGEFLRIGQTTRLTQTANGITTPFEITISSAAVNVFGDPLARHQSAEVRTIPAEPGDRIASSIIVKSPTAFEWRNTFAYRVPFNGPVGSCELFLHYQWIRP